MTYPLAGVRILELGQIIAGTYGSQVLTDLGAEVIKIEPPEGDVLRRRKRETEPYPLVMLNSNKESVVLDLKQPEAKKIFLALVEKADVLIENFAAGVMDRLGLGYDVLSKLNPRLVYGGSSGFGLDGPYRDLAAMDVTIQAMSGIMGVTGFPDGPPVKSGSTACDFIAGTHVYGAVMTALFERERTGKGRVVEVTMQDAVYASLASNLGMVHARGPAAPCCRVRQCARSGRAQIDRANAVAAARWARAASPRGWPSSNCSPRTHSTKNVLAPPPPPGRPRAPSCR